LLLEENLEEELELMYVPPQQQSTFQVVYSGSSQVEAQVYSFMLTS